jgi:hypothetical protein
LASPLLLFNLLFCLFIKFTLNKKQERASPPFSSLETFTLISQWSTVRPPFSLYPFLALPCSLPTTQSLQASPFPFWRKKKRKKEKELLKKITPNRVGLGFTGQLSLPHTLDFLLYLETCLNPIFSLSPLPPF